MSRVKKRSKVRVDITCLVTEEQQEMDRINSQTGDHEQQNTVKNTCRVEKTPDLQAQRIVHCTCLTATALFA